MQAIYITAFLADASPYTTLRATTVRKPIPATGELLIKVTHTAPQQVDLLYARGKHQNNNIERGHVHPPFTLGLDFAGIVESIPDSYTHNKDALSVGTRVMGSATGTFAEYFCTTPDGVRRVPSNLSNASAAALAGGVVSFDAVHRVAHVRLGQTVLVTGANGGLGAVACQVARASGATVIALVSTSARAVFLRKRLGLEHVVTMGNTKGSMDWAAEVMRVTAGKGVDTVIDNVGCVKQSLRCLRFGGQIVLVGFAGRGGVMEDVGMNRVLLKGATVIGYRFGEQCRQRPQTLEDAWRGYERCLASGAVRALLDPREYSGIADIPRALQDLSNRQLRGKAVITINRATNEKL